MPVGSKRYVVATQRTWGRAVFDRVVVDPERWACLHFESEDPADCADDAGRLEALLSEMEPRYAFFLNWSARVPADLLERYECVNMHCTPLPYGRGGHPIENLILNGFKTTTMTAHRMVAEIDAGPVYYQGGSIGLSGAKAEILARFVDPCAAIIRRIVESEPEPMPQGGRVVKFSRLSPDAYREFWGKRQ